MSNYIGLLKWTEQGIRNVKDTLNRAEQAGKLFERAGGRLRTVYWTQGPYDALVIAEFPDDETASAAMLALAMGGNVRTEMLRAFTADEMQRILQKMP